MALNNMEHRAESKEQKKLYAGLLTSSLLRFALCAMLVVLSGCATLTPDKNIVALVDGEPVTETDLNYALQVAHRREDLSSARALNYTEYVQKLINDRLLVQEARRMGLEQDPGIRQAVQAFVLRESVVRLHNEEIMQRIVITEKDVENYYKENYEQFTLSIIALKSEAEAGDILEKLKKGEDFKELRQKYSVEESKEEKPEVTLPKRSLSPQLSEAVSKLKPGEFSEVIKIRDRYLIARFIDRKKAPDEELQKYSEAITQNLKKTRQKELEGEYLKLYRERAPIKINKELLAEVRSDGGKEGQEKWSKDKRPLVEVYDSILTLGDFVSMSVKYGEGKKREKTDEEIINNWISHKLLDHEALSRKYEVRTGLKHDVQTYENSLLQNAFIKNVVAPAIVIDEHTVKDYYLKHQKNYSKPAMYKLQHITVKTREEADKIYDNLKSGADFLWAAKTTNKDTEDPKAFELGWISADKLPEALRGIMGKLKKGDISPVFETDSQFRIVRLQDKIGEGVEDFEDVKDAAANACYQEKFSELLNSYLIKLKEDTQIKVFDDAIKSLEARMKK